MNKNELKSKEKTRKNLLKDLNKKECDFTFSILNRNKDTLSPRSSVAQLLLHEKRLRENYAEISKSIPILNDDHLLMMTNHTIKVLKRKKRFFYVGEIKDERVFPHSRNPTFRISSSYPDYGDIEELLEISDEISLEAVTVNIATEDYSINITFVKVGNLLALDGVMYDSDQYPIKIIYPNRISEGERFYFELISNHIETVKNKVLIHVRSENPIFDNPPDF